MAELILHHYAGSPFAEKICTILGYKGVEWRSVRIPPTLPRPLLAPLTGDYRRTPVLQVGGHVYCDTRCIVAFLERQFPTPTLFPQGSRFASDMMTFWVEPKTFVAMAPLRFRSAEDVEGIFDGVVDAESFVQDRTPFMRGALDVARTAELVPAAWDHVRTFLAVIDRALESGEPHLTGPDPSIADFSAYHLAWWLDHRPRVSAVLDERPRVRDWLRRMAAFGHGNMKPMQAKEALEEARRSEAKIEPRVDAEEPFSRNLEQRVRVAADDYGRDPVIGELVSSTLDEIVLRREHPDAGIVLQHFPRIGFEILPAVEPPCGPTDRR